MALVDNLVSYWKMDEASGNRADSHGSNTLVDNDTVGSDTGKIGTYAANFVATNTEWLEIADASQTGLDFNGSSFSFSLWVYHTSQPASGDEHLYFSKWHASTPAYFCSYHNNGGVPRFQLQCYDTGTPTENIAFLSPNQTLSNNTWYHIVVTFDPASTGTATFYVNGVSIGSDDNASWSGTMNNSAGGFAIGALTGGGSRYMDGRIDEVGVWNRVLTADEVTSLYNSGNGLAYPLTVAGAAVPSLATLGVGA
jgi:hypothetical protein